MSWLPLRLPVRLERLLGLRRLRLGLRRLLPVLGLRLSLVLDQKTLVNVGQRGSQGRVLLDPAFLSYLRHREC
jgi:hypothetical protein